MLNKGFIRSDIDVLFEKRLIPGGENGLGAVEFLSGVETKTDFSGGANL